MKPYTSIGMGYTYNKSKTSFKVYATKCEAVNVLLYDDYASYRRTSYSMTPLGESLWELTIEGDLHLKAYMYQVVRGKMVYTATDPFGLASTANSRRSVVVDFDRVTCPDFDKDHYVPIPMEEAVLYETHIRDFTMHPHLKLEHPGKYLGVTESQDHVDYGLDYIKDLGITHVHFLPLQDFLSIDEHDPKGYNWGYDPEQYFVPEGSYATNPDDPVARLVELKTMVKAIHDKGMAVVLDVVYNHTYRGGENPLAVLAPFTYYRHMPDGSYSNGSGCGNEIHTEHPMARQLIMDSLIHWMKVFHIDGFRFDLMGLMDTETAFMIEREVHKINPHAILYGEPWTGGGSTLAFDKMMLKGKQRDHYIALFNDDYRSALKGDSDGKDHGFVQGYKAKIHDIKTGLVGSIRFSDHHVGFAKEPRETINYFSAHDNLIFYDKMKYSTMWDDLKVKSATKMAFSLILLAFGIPFIQAGTEFMRTKQMDHNSYKSSDAINAIDWRLVATHKDLVDHVKNLITLRNHLGCFTSYSSEDICKKVVLHHMKHLLVYTIRMGTGPYRKATILINPLHEDATVRLRLKKDCKVIYDGQSINMTGHPHHQVSHKRHIVLKPFQTVVIVSPKADQKNMTF